MCLLFFYSLLCRPVISLCLLMRRFAVWLGSVFVLHVLPIVFASHPKSTLENLFSCRSPQNHDCSPEEVDCLLRPACLHVCNSNEMLALFVVSRPSIGLRSNEDACLFYPACLCPSVPVSCLHINRTWRKCSRRTPTSSLT